MPRTSSPRGALVVLVASYVGAMACVPRPDEVRGAGQAVQLPVQPPPPREDAEPPAEIPLLVDEVAAPITDAGAVQDLPLSWGRDLRPYAPVRGGDAERAKRTVRVRVGRAR